MKTQFLSLLAVIGVLATVSPMHGSGASAGETREGLQRFVETHCVDCHGESSRTANLALDELLDAEIREHADAWEKVIRKLRTRQMPPPDMPRPDERSYDNVASWLESSLDNFATQHPDPGRMETFRRLTRMEYQNAIRDLLALEIDASTLLPPDESSHGFDNVTVSGLSPTLVNRYLAAAEKISRLAVGRASGTVAAESFRMRADITQDTHVEGLPFGTRGGMLIPYNFPQTGEYEINVRLMRDRHDDVEALREPHELEIRLDRERVGLFTVKPMPRSQNVALVDAHLESRVPVTAGSHDVAVAFLQQSSSLLETRRQPLNVHFNFYRHPRQGPAIYEVTIVGPFEAEGSGDTPSRRRIFVCEPSGPADEEACAERILAKLLRRAYRRPIVSDDLTTPMEFFRQGCKEGGFDGGIERALSAVLVNPQFLFRIERDTATDEVYRISDTELASRLSFFLWSSIPDDELLVLAERNELSRPDVLDAQVRRMLADERSRSLVTNFADQWLYLRNLDSVTPDMRLFPDFDHNLREALRTETELFFESVLREDRSVLDLIHADYTFLNERLAKHYEIPNIFGSRFRRVKLDPETHRGGLLRQGSILTVTSYATRTSPVIRGKWILENLLGSPPPPPPPNIPDLKENTIDASLSVRERLAAHRANPACASCHQLMDPVGFALEEFDAVGRWRELEEGQPIDASGGLPDGSEFDGAAGLEQAMLDRPELFVQTLTEKLLTYALGRGLEYYDAPAVRKIVREAREDGYRFSPLILGIVHSTPFQMRKAE